MSVNNRSSIDPRYKNHARLPLTGFANARIRLFDPQTATADIDFNAWTNGFTTEPVILWEGDGQLAVFRQTLNAFMPVGGVTQIRSVRFVIPSNGPAAPIRKGLQVRVLECADQPDATAYQYTVTSGITGTLAFTRDIEAEADMGVILPPLAP